MNRLIHAGCDGEIISNVYRNASGNGEEVRRLTCLKCGTVTEEHVQIEYVDMKSMKQEGE